MSDDVVEVVPLKRVEGTPPLLRLSKEPLEPAAEPGTLRGQVAAIIDPVSALPHPAIDALWMQWRQREALRRADEILALIEAAVVAEYDRRFPDHTGREERDAIAAAFQAKVNEAAG